VDEASALLQTHKGNARVTAGGTIVVHRMKERIGVRNYLLGLKAIEGLDDIAFDGASGLRIGAMASLQSLAESPVVRENFEILATACGKLGTPQIRNMGTIGGNVCSKFPEAETVPVLIALGAEAKIVNGSGEKKVALEDLNKELKQTDLLTEIFVPTPAPHTKWGYEKFAIRERLDYATAAAAVVIIRSNGICEDVRIAIGGVSAKRATQAENVLKGQSKTEAVIKAAAEEASKKAKTVSDIHFSADYKKDLLNVMVKRALEQAWAS